MKQTEKYQPLFEMAKVGEIDDLIIQVYTDHNPPHFHVIKKDAFEVRISIKTVDIINYKWQKGNKEISTSELKKISKWLKSNYKNKQITNRDAVEMFWDGMNSK